MDNLFKRRQPSGNTVYEIKNMVMERFSCKEATVISVAEL